MRSIIWCAIGAILGIAVGIWFLNGSALLIVGLALGVVSILVSFLFPSDSIKKGFAYVLVLCSIGMCWTYVYDYIFVCPARKLDGQCMNLTVQVIDYSQPSKSGTVADGRIHLNNRAVSVKLYMHETVTLSPGDKVMGEFTVKFTGYDRKLSSTYHQGKDVQLYVFAAENAYISHSSKSGYRNTVADIRQFIHKSLNIVFPADTLGFAKALLLGDSSDLSVKDDNALQNSGIRHIIAVSGLHVSILCSFLNVVFLKRRWLIAMVGVPLLVSFAAIAGFTPSVIRACIMQGLMILANVLDREYDQSAALSFAVLVLLAVNPYTLTFISFQLSVSCVVGIFLFSSKILKFMYKWDWLKKQTKGKTRKAKFFRWVTSSVSVSLSAMSLTIPISAYYFGVVSLVGVLANLLTLWVITYIFCGIIIASVFSFVYTPLGGVIAWVISWPMRYVLWISGLLSAIPFSAVSIENTYICMWLLFAYTMILLTLLSSNKRVMLMLGCILTGLISAVLLSYLEYKQDRFRMTVLDVGQGQCIILQNKESCYVVDCGGSSAEATADLAIQTLRTLGVSSVDGLILTHFDKDHAGGANSFLSQMKTEALYIPDADPEDEIRLTLEENYSDLICWVYSNQYISCGDDYLTIYPQDFDTTGNESSMCILFQNGNYDILITGDLDADGERVFVDNVRLPDVDVLVAGHHGAETSTSMYFLNKIRPKAAVISAGDGNIYGHPNWETIDRLELFGCRIWRTDLNGTIVFRG